MLPIIRRELASFQGADGRLCLERIGGMDISFFPTSKHANEGPLTEPDGDHHQYHNNIDETESERGVAALVVLSYPVGPF